MFLWARRFQWNLKVEDSQVYKLRIQSHISGFHSLQIRSCAFNFILQLCHHCVQTLNPISNWECPVHQGIRTFSELHSRPLAFKECFHMSSNNVKTRYPNHSHIIIHRSSALNTCSLNAPSFTNTSIQLTISENFNNCVCSRLLPPHFPSEVGTLLPSTGGQSNCKFLSWGSVFQIQVPNTLPRFLESRV